MALFHAQSISGVTPSGIPKVDIKALLLLWLSF